LRAGNDFWTAEQQALGGKAGKMQKSIEKRYPKIKGTLFN